MQKNFNPNDFTVLIVSEVRGFYIKAITDKLRQESYHVSVIGANIDDIHDFDQKIGAILIYADVKLIEQNNALVYLKDKAVEEDVPIFVIGDLVDFKRIESLIPVKLISGEFVRPIDILDVINKITQAIKKYFQQRKILVVDDSGSMLRSIKEWLEDKYNVYIANSGAMAIKSLALNKPDLVLLDYDMPICDGKTVLEMIRAEADFKDVPVMFLTNIDSKDVIMSVQDLNLSGYMLKSMQPSRIVSEINNFFAKRKPMDL